MSRLPFPVRVYRDDSPDSIREKSNPLERLFVRIPGEGDATTEAGGRGDVYELVHIIEIDLENCVEEQAMAHVLSTLAEYWSDLDDNFQIQTMFYIVLQQGLKQLGFEMELALPKSRALLGLITGLPNGPNILEQLLRPVYDWGAKQRD